MSALVHIPYLLATAVIERMSVGAEDMPPTMIVTFVIAMIVFALSYVVLEGAIVLAAARRYVGGPGDAGTVIRESLSRLGGLTITVLGKWMAVSLASIFLLVPGFYVFAGYFAVPAAMLIERIPARASVRRSWALSRNGKLRILGTLGVSYILYFMLSGMPAIIPGIGSAISGAMSVLIFPLISCSTVLLYYDARIRHEGFDIEYMAGGLEPEPSPAPANLA